jgi:hypothetical protein
VEEQPVKQKLAARRRAVLVVQEDPNCPLLKNLHNQYRVVAPHVSQRTKQAGDRERDRAENRLLKDASIRKEKNELKLFPLDCQDNKHEHRRSVCWEGGEERKE